MTFPARGPLPAAAARLRGAPPRGRWKVSPVPRGRGKSVPCPASPDPPPRGESERTALWGQAVATTRPRTERSLSSRGAPAVAGVRVCRAAPGSRGCAPRGGAWPGAAVPAAPRAGRAGVWGRLPQSRRGSGQSVPVSWESGELRRMGRGGGSCAVAAGVEEGLRCGWDPRWTAVLYYPGLQERGGYLPGHFSEQSEDHQDENRKYWGIVSGLFLSNLFFLAECCQNGR